MKFGAYTRNVTLIGASVVLTMGMSLSAIVRTVRAADTGGYPWANAVPLNQHQYDWGYGECLPPMQASGVCGIVRITPDGRRFYVSDPWRYALRNCTSYVAWRVNSEFGVSIPAWGNANTWDNNAARQGHAVDNAPQLNDIAVWEGAYGHVAFVVGVNNDGTVNIEQYNQAGTGMFSRQSRVRAHHYIHLGLTKASVSVAAVPAAVVPPTPPEPPKIPEDPKTPRSQPIVAASKQPLADTSATIFSLNVDPKTDKTLAYAVDFAQTASGRVELSRSNPNDGNTSWDATWTTPFMTNAADEAAYIVTDHDADGFLDLMQIKHSASTSGQTEVSVATGKSKYKELIATWRTSEPVQTSKVKAKYSVADFDGDGAMDIVKLQKQPDVNAQKITILSGAKQYQEQVGSWEVPSPTSEQNASADQDSVERLLVGDDDRDGKPDILDVPVPSTHSTQSVGRVYAAMDNFSPTSRSWYGGR